MSKKIPIVDNQTLEFSKKKHKDFNYEALKMHMRKYQFATDDKQSLFLIGIGNVPGVVEDLRPNLSETFRRIIGIGINPTVVDDAIHTYGRYYPIEHFDRLYFSDPMDYDDKDGYRITICCLRWNHLSSVNFLTLKKRLTHPGFGLNAYTFAKNLGEIIRPLGLIGDWEPFITPLVEMLAPQIHNRRYAHQFIRFMNNKLLAQFVVIRNYIGPHNKRTLKGYFENFYQFSQHIPANRINYFYDYIFHQMERIIIEMESGPFKNATVHVIESKHFVETREEYRNYRNLSSPTTPGASYSSADMIVDHP